MDFDTLVDALPAKPTGNINRRYGAHRCTPHTTSWSKLTAHAVTATAKVPAPTLAAAAVGSIARYDSATTVTMVSWWRKEPKGKVFHG